VVHRPAGCTGAGRILRAALFAVLGPTLHLGAFATYDAMSMFLVALAAWLVVRAGDRQDATVWMLAAGVTLALANATRVLVRPVRPRRDPARPGRRLPEARRQARRRPRADPPGHRGPAGHAGLLIGGSRYLHGVESRRRWPGSAVPTPRCPFSPVPGPGPASSSWPRSAALSSAGSSSRERAQTWLLTLLAAAALLVPLEQASLHTTASLNKHVDLGAWFAAIAAGYAVDKFIAAAPAGNMRAITGGACVIALSFPVSLGAGQSRAFSTSWPNSSAFIAILRPLADHGTGHLLVEDPSIAEYYLHAGSQWKRWSARGTSSCREGALPAARATKAGLSAPATPAPSPCTSGRLLFPGRAELLRHGIPGQEHRRGPQAQPSLPRIQVVPYGPARPARRQAPT
jgi:hypothetical protein